MLTLLGSGEGLNKLKQGDYDFAVSETSLTKTELEDQNLEMVPLFISGVALLYNIPNFKSQLILSRSAVAGIFSGEIQYWNDNRIQQTNSETLPNHPIQPIVRSTSSGSTSIFTSSLSHFSPTLWKYGKVTMFPNITSTNFVSVLTSLAVTESIIKLEYSIGYGSPADAAFMSIPVAKILNKAGNPVAPSISSFKAAAQNFLTVDNYFVEIVDGDAESYPCAGVSYFLFRKTLSSCDKKKFIFNFLSWIYTISTPSTSDLIFETNYFAPIPNSYKEHLVNSIVNQISCGTLTLSSLPHLEQFGYAMIAVGSVALSLCFTLALVGGVRCYYVRKHRELHKIMSYIEEGPSGKPILIMFSDIQNSTKIWEHVPKEDMDHCIKRHHEIVRSLLTAFNGYEVKTEGDSFMVAFGSIVDAVKCVNLIHTRMMKEDWPPSLLSFPTNVETVDDDGQIIFNGFRVRMGLHFLSEGEYSAQLDPTTKRTDYFGPGVNLAARIADIALDPRLLVRNYMTCWKIIQISRKNVENSFLIPMDIIHFRVSRKKENYS